MQLIILGCMILLQSYTCTSLHNVKKMLLREKPTALRRPLVLSKLSQLSQAGSRCINDGGVMGWARPQCPGRVHSSSTQNPALCSRAPARLIVSQAGLVLTETEECAYLYASAPAFQSGTQRGSPSAASTLPGPIKQDHSNQYREQKEN